ncbi:MAG: type II secretion system protein [Candidatus Eremiobacteraeota bacterium]|nr:type II secretion system protein [Candidatus Eremiobacteraeota bacterium]
MVRVVKNRALTLLETIVSIFIISMLVLLLMQLFPTSFLAGRRSVQHSEAGRVAEEVLVQKRLLPFHELTSGEENLEGVERNGVLYTRTVTIFELPEANPEKLKGIRVLVNWEERGKTWTVRRDFLQVRLPR